MKVSVCLATFNGEKYISDQITSILSQLAPDDEIIISDDGSTDNTLNIIRSFNDERIKIYNNKTYDEEFMFKFSKVTKNFENALSKVTGDIIYLSDQDDVWLPNKVNLMSSELGNVDFVLSDCIIVDDSLTHIVSSKFQLEKVKIGFFRNIYKSGYLGCCMAFRKELLNLILPFPNNVPHDLWIGLVSASKGKINMINVPTLLYRRHQNNVSATNSLFREKKIGLPLNNNSLYFKILYRYITIKAYLIRRIKQFFKLDIKI